MIVPKLGLIWMLANCGAYVDLGVHKGPCFFIEMNECILATEAIRIKLKMEKAPACYYEEVGAEIG